MADYFSPVTEETLEKLSEEILGSIKQGQNLTITFKRQSGGARAWLKYLLFNERRRGLQKNIENYQWFYFEPTDCLEENVKAFFYQILKILSPEVKQKYEEITLEAILENIKTRLGKLTKNGSVVLFLAKLNSFPDINPIIGNLLYRMWKPFEGRFSLITTITEDNNTNLNNWGELREVLGQNVIMIPKLDSKDMLHSVRHWGEILNYKFNTEEEKLIVKLSQGSPYISKLLCQSLISKPKSEEAGAFLKRVIKERLPWIERGTLRIETTTKSIWLDDSNVSLVFTPQEQLVLMCLQEKQGEVISRDKIAEILWGDQQYEKYSDWAIDKLVSILRFKINGLNCKSEIQTVKGKGYMYLGG